LIIAKRLPTVPTKTPNLGNLTPEFNPKFANLSYPIPPKEYLEPNFDPSLCFFDEKKEL